MKTIKGQLSEINEVLKTVPNYLSTNEILPEDLIEERTSWDEMKNYCDEMKNYIERIQSIVSNTDTSEEDFEQWAQGEKSNMYILQINIWYNQTRTFSSGTDYILYDYNQCIDCIYKYLHDEQIAFLKTLRDSRYIINLHLLDIPTYDRPYIQDIEDLTDKFNYGRLSSKTVLTMEIK